MKADKKRGFYEARLMPSLALLGMPLPDAQLISPYGKIFKNMARLSFLQIKANRAIQPWKEIFETISATEFSDKDWTAKPKAVLGLDQELESEVIHVWQDRDSLAACVSAMLWYYCGDKNHAQCAVRQFEAWSRIASESGRARAAAESTSPDSVPEAAPGSHPSGLISPTFESEWGLMVFSIAAGIIRRTYREWMGSEPVLFYTQLKEARSGKPMFEKLVLQN